jgi:hypothetical protein
MELRLEMIVAQRPKIRDKMAFRERIRLDVKLGKAWEGYKYPTGLASNSNTDVLLIGLPGTKKCNPALTAAFSLV